MFPSLVSDDVVDLRISEGESASLGDGFRDKPGSGGERRGSAVTDEFGSDKVSDTGYFLSDNSASEFLGKLFSCPYGTGSHSFPDSYHGEYLFR